MPQAQIGKPLQTVMETFISDRDRLPVGGEVAFLVKEARETNRLFQNGAKSFSLDRTTYYRYSAKLGGVKVKIEVIYYADYQGAYSAD